jgi:hypothetical protein
MTVLKIHRSPFLFAVVAALASTGCANGAGVDQPETVDTIRLELAFGGGVTLTSVDYVLTGPGAFRRADTFPVGADDTIMGTFQNLAAGAYLIKVVGTASDDASICKGEVMFNVASMMNTVVQIPLMCSGRAAVTADFNNCPFIDSLSATPAEVFVGSSIQLAMEAHDPDNMPLALVATWATSSGTLTGMSTAGATFTCTVPGTFLVQVKVTDGTPGTKCPDTASVSVVCTAPTASLIPVGGVATKAGA